MNYCSESEAQVSGVQLQEVCNQHFYLMGNRNKDMLSITNKPISYWILMMMTTHLEKVPHTTDDKQEATNNSKHKNLS